MADPPLACHGKRKRGQYCVVAWCSNFFGCRIDEPISFFSFPKDQQRANAWLKFAQREDCMGKESKNLRICSDHFLESDFKSKKPRVLLKMDAIPTQYERNLPKINDAAMNMDIQEIDSTPPMPSIDIIDNSPTATDVEMEVEAGYLEESPVMSCAPVFVENGTVTPKCRWSARSVTTPRTSKRLANLRRTVARLRTNLFRARAKPVAENGKVERETLVELGRKYLPKTSHKLFMAQVQLCNMGKFGRRWSPYMKDFALSLYYHGPKAYRFLQKTLCLPSVRSLLNWQKEVIVKPGIDDNALAALERHSKNLTYADSLVSLVFDEVAIKESFYYDSSVDSILGFCNYGDETVPTIGDHCLVSMVKGINKKWKQSIGYWVTHKSTSADVLQKIVLDCIDKVSSVGFNVKVLICDQGPHNLTLSRYLGVTPENPFFVLGEEKIYFMFDPPHLLKSIRNNLFKYNFNFNGNLVEWSHLRKLFELTDPLKLKMIPKITKFHVVVKPFKKMRVKLASEVFSSSVSVAMSAFVAMGKLSSQAENTAQFFDFMDRLFDSFNSSQVRCHPFKYRYAIGEDTPHVEFLKDAYLKLKRSKFVGCKAQPRCLKGWLVSIRSLLALYADLKDQYGIPRLCTRVLNQDALENFFSVIRQQHGCNDNPTVMQFGKGYKHLLLTSISKLSSNSNCELDLESFLVRISQFLCKSSNKDSTDSQAEVVFNFSDLNFSEMLDTSECQIISNVCGLLCGMFMKKHPCSSCREAMAIASPSHRGIGEHSMQGNGELEWGAHLNENEIVFRAVKEWECIFQCAIMELLHTERLAEQVMHMLMATASYEEMVFPCVGSKRLFASIFVNYRIRVLVRSLNETYCK